MARFGFLLACLLALVLPPSAARAYRFGTDETINVIQDVKLKGAKDEALFLGYMTRMHFFLAGTYVEDAGYVLGVRGESKTFYPMPEGQELARFQRGGFLPDPLPPYSLTALDYIFGYSLWWLLPIIALLVWWGDRRKKGRAAAAAASPAASPLPPTPPPSAPS